MNEVAWPCPTLCDTMDCSLLGSSIHGIFHARILEWGNSTDQIFYILTDFMWPTIERRILKSVLITLDLAFPPFNSTNFDAYILNFCYMYKYLKLL